MDSGKGRLDLLIMTAKTGLTARDRETARTEAILKSLSIAERMSRIYMRRHRTNPEEVLAEAVLGVVEGVDWLIDNELPQVKGQMARVCMGVIGNKVRQHITEFIPYDRTITLTRNVMRSLIKRGCVPTPSSVSEDDKLGEQRFIHPETYDSEINDLCKFYGICDRKKDIVLMLVEGNTDEQVANIFNISKQRIGQIRQELAETITNIYHNFGERCLYGKDDINTIGGGDS